jgi:integrase
VAIHKLGDTDKLTSKKLKEIMSEPGNHADGGGLYLKVGAPGQGSWMVRFPYLGKDGWKDRWASLGPADEITADAARKLHGAMKDAKRAGGDPWALIETKEAEERAEQAASVLFGSLIEPYLALNATGWKGGTDGHEASEYRKTLSGLLSAIPAATITSADVQKHLERFPPARADKVRMRIMQVISYAVATGVRADGPNPARKEVIKHLVPAAPKSKPHPSMPVAMVPEFMAKLAADGSNEARSLAFLIHTAARTAEARDMDWKEINGNVWTVPGGLPVAGERTMKETIEHSVPLTDAALALLGPRGSGRIFGDLPHDALIDKVKELGGDYTTHGMRTAFNVWAKKAGYPKYLRDIALAHAVGSATDQSYDHGDPLIEERRPMMQAWSDYVAYP